ncbi:hypothetical protein KBI23_05575 [bacterium]|nr:hypothetical protein [bacterium]MBP9810597.1 hypothetical protein [bacterium]
MNANKKDTINSNNASRFKSDLEDQITMMELLTNLFADLSQEPDDENLSWLAAAFFSTNTTLGLARDCLSMIEAQHYETASETFYLVIEQYERVSALLDSHKNKAPFVVTTSADDLLALEQQLNQINTDLATWRSDQSAISAMILALKKVSKEAAESLYIGQGQPEMMFTESKIEDVVQSLIGQIMESDSSTTEAMAREMVEEALGSTVDQRRSFLLNDLNNRGHVQSVNVQAGAALSAVGEVALAQSLASVLSDLLQQDIATATQANKEILVDPLDLMLLEAEGNLGKPIHVEQDGLLSK